MAEKMSEDVVYSEVVFMKKNTVEKDDPGETDLAPQKSKACCDCVRLVLLALCVVMAGGLIALCFQYVRTEKKFMDLQELRNALDENFTAISAAIQDMHKQQQNLSRALNDSACPKDWEYHAGKCYYFSTNLLDWAKSRDACISDGGHLVIINNKDEQEFLLSILKTKYKYPFWIGLTDQEKEGKWLWVDNTELTDRSYWINDEPDNWKGSDGRDYDGEDCARIEKYDSGLKSWFDAFCRYSLRRICETKSSRQT